jgi:hypothetical protein
MDYQTFRYPQPDRDTPRISLLLQVDGSGHAGEGYRFAVDCDRITATIWSRDLFDTPELEGYKLIYDLRGEDIDIRPNSMASKWEDLETLIGREKILVFNPSGDDVLNALFREKWAAERAVSENLGAAIRWAVQATPRGEMRLILQGLPAGARYLRSQPLLTADDSAAIHLESFAAEADMKAEGSDRGLVPTLFARDPGAAREALALHPERLLAGNTEQKKIERKL